MQIFPKNIPLRSGVKCLHSNVEEKDKVLFTQHLESSRRYWEPINEVQDFYPPHFRPVSTLHWLFLTKCQVSNNNSPVNADYIRTCDSYCQYGNLPEKSVNTNPTDPLKALFSLSFTVEAKSDVQPTGKFISLPLYWNNIFEAYCILHSCAWSQLFYFW